ncbi:hypothetical protein HN51_055560 [Arachis hypogaea]
MHQVTTTYLFAHLAASIPLMYMCVCTYYSLFKMGVMMFYRITPRQTSSVIFINNWPLHLTSSF